MSAKFSPGPWSAKIEPITYPECDDADLPAVVRDADGKAVVWMNERYDDGTNYEDDARLIAAAPDLLSAATDALNYIESTESELGIELGTGRKLRAAIAKAEQSS